MATDQTTAGGSRPRMIATEEAWATKEFMDAYLSMAAGSDVAGTRYAAQVIGRPQNLARLTEIEARIEDMDAHGVDMHLLSLTSPGVQVFDAEYAVGLAARCNDEMAKWVQKYPTRFAGLAAVAPQDPKAAAAEVERAISGLGLHGLIINSHTKGEFLDDRKFWPILEAAVKHRAPIYIHPTFPAPAMAKPFEPYGLSGAVWGFAAECGLHAMRMILGGVFDEFPELQIVLGHMGEGLPYWLFRMDNISWGTVKFANKALGIEPTKRPPSEYVRSNFHITTSGMFWDDVLDFGIKAVGIERILFAIDYPYENSKMATDWINKTPLPDHDRALILSGNTTRLFNIK